MKEKSEKMRRLTSAEQKRLEIFESRKEELLKKGYTFKELTIHEIKANGLAFLFWLPFGVIFSLLFFGKYPADFSSLEALGLPGLLLLLAAIVVHEGLHGLGWGLAAGFDSIEFGFILKYLTPYCYCGRPQKKSTYIIGGLLPFVILGLLPVIYSLLTGSLFWFLFGNVMIMGAGGDLAICWMIVFGKIKKQSLLQDHPIKVGQCVFDK